MRLYKEQERICRKLGDKAVLQACLGNQGNIHKDRRELDKAMRLYREKERICEELGDPKGLAISLVNQSLVLDEKGHPKDAVRLAEEAYQLASKHGYAALVRQIKDILDDIRLRMK